MLPNSKPKTIGGDWLNFSCRNFTAEFKLQNFLM